MKAFVAGATGLTGRFVVERWAEGIVLAHVRPDSHGREWTERFEGLGAVVTHAVAGGAMKTDGRRSSNRLRAPWDHQKRIKSAGDGDYMVVDYGMTAMLVDALASSKETRFVYLSSLGSKEGVSSAYMKARWLAEDHLRQSGLPHLIARPSFILGERDEPRMMESIGGGISAVLLGIAGLLGAKKTASRFGSIQGKQLGQALVREALAWPADNRTLYSDDLRESSNASQES